MMKSSLKNRLDELESASTDWISKLNVIDYLGIDDYDNGEWQEVFFDNFITVVRHVDTNEVRGYYNDRRSDAEIVEAGGDLAYL